MKRFILLLLAFVLVLGLASCKDKPAGNNEKDKAQVQTDPSLLDELQGKIKADGKLLGVAYLGWIEGDAETAKAELAKHGISCEGKRAVQLKKSDYDKYDLFIGMDSMNIRNMHRILGADNQGKIRKLMDFTNRGGDVADPWYSGRFDVAYRDIEEGCKALLQYFEG